MIKSLLGCALAGLFALNTAQAATITDQGPVAIEARDSGLPEGWAQHGVFVEILVRAYQDSNGDGIGDLNGLTSRLDYLKSLGVSGIWLMPIFKSQDHDHGYHVTDFRAIEPDYGTLADFDRLIAEAHRRGIGVIIDYTLNHSSAEHPLFDAATDGKNSPYRDWYVWAKPKPSGWTTFSGDPWHEVGDEAYYGAFGDALPDFNLRNPAVLDFHLDNLKFWLNRGVDGFRFDAVGVLVENSSVAWENQPENHQIMHKVRALLDQYGKRYMVCEAPSDPGAFAAADSCGSAFAFGLQKHIIKSVKMGRLMPDVLYTLKTLPVARMGTLLANHDAFAGNRLYQQLQGDEAAYKLAAATLLTLPGTPFIYYGEEIGLSASTPVAQQDQELRGPMSWTAGNGAGFTSGKPFRPLVENARTHNVATEDGKPGSLLNFYRTLIKLRTAEPALSTGSFTALSKEHEPIFAFLREQGDTRLLVALNYAARPASIGLPADIDCKSLQLVAAQPATKAVPASGKSCELKLAPQQVLILKAPRQG